MHKEISIGAHRWAMEVPIKITDRFKKEAFLKGFVKAIGFASGTCLLCKKCIIQEDFMKGIPIDIARRYCRHKNKARPSLEAVGIDVFKTAKNVGFTLTPPKGVVRWTGLILVD